MSEPTMPIKFGTVRTYDAEHGVGYITPELKEDESMPLVFFTRNARNHPLEQLPIEGARIGYKVNIHPKIPFASDWYIVK